MDKKIYLTDSVKTAYVNELIIGRRGEYNVERVIIDLHYFKDNYGSGRAELTFTAPNSNQEFPVPTEPYGDDECSIVWDITDAVTAVEGEGSIRLNYYTDSDGLKLSPKVLVKIIDGAKDRGTAPDPVEDWIKTATELYYYMRDTMPAELKSYIDGLTPVEVAKYFASHVEELRGERGFTGEKGDKGDKGDQGIQGIPGIQGEKGDTGAQGIQGPKGEKGDTGAQGIQGEQGIQGIKGDTGEQGPKGDKGDTGEKGEKGEQGPKGDKGDPGTTSWNDLTDKPFYHDERPVNIEDIRNFEFGEVSYGGSAYGFFDIPNQQLISGKTYTLQLNNVTVSGVAQKTMIMWMNVECGIALYSNGIALANVDSAIRVYRTTRGGKDEFKQLIDSMYRFDISDVMHVAHKNIDPVFVDSYTKNESDERFTYPDFNNIKNNPLLKSKDVPFDFSVDFICKYFNFDAVDISNGAGYVTPYVVIGKEQPLKEPGELYDVILGDTESKARLVGFDTPYGKRNVLQLFINGGSIYFFNSDDAFIAMPIGYNANSKETAISWLKRNLLSLTRIAIIGITATIRHMDDDFADEVGIAKASEIAKISDRVETKVEGGRVLPISNSVDIAQVYETAGCPEYIGNDDLSKYSSFGLTESGWYLFARINSRYGESVSNGFSVVGASGVITPSIESNHVDIAVRFGVIAESQKVIVNWGASSETFVFKATDLAIRNLDYRVTFYLYNIDDYCEWTYEITTDAKFVKGKGYYKLIDDEYVKEDVTVDDAVPANTYYCHKSLVIKDFTRNMSYTLDTTVDCPVTINLPEVGGDNYGAWFEVQMNFLQTYSVTIIPAEGQKVSATGVHQPKAGINIINILYHMPTNTWLPTVTNWAFSSN